MQISSVASTSIIFATKTSITLPLLKRLTVKEKQLISVPPDKVHSTNLQPSITREPGKIQPGRLRKGRTGHQQGCREEEVTVDARPDLPAR